MTERIQKDPDLAYSYHCNIAVAIQGEGVEYITANKAAARIMKMLYNVDTSTSFPGSELL